MRQRLFAPLGRELSTLVLGTDALRELDAEPAYELLDTWVELGGNVLDTAREYGAAERHIGRWLQDRGLRDEVVVVTKGGHPDETTWRSRLGADELQRDLRESLDALGADAVDVYLLHRDDPARPAGTVVETLNGQRAAGHIRVFGASNWTCARLGEAEAFAAAHGLESFGCSSLQLSLAVPREAPWRGTVGAHAWASRAWHAQRQLPLLAWSSQAGGFFAGVRSPFVERVYESDENRERRPVRRVSRGSGAARRTRSRSRGSCASRSRSSRSSAPARPPSSARASRRRSWS